MLLAPKISAATPAVQAILEKVDAAVKAVIAKAKNHIETGKGILVDLLETIIAKIGELKDNVAGYNIFDDLLSDVLKPALEKAIENLIPTIAKHLGDLADKLKPAEYMAITDIMEIAQHIKDIFNELKAKIESGEVKASVIDFLKHLKEVIDAKVAAARPIVQEALVKVQAAVDEMIAKVEANVEAGIEQGRGVLVELLEKIMAKLAELKDQLAGYSIFDDLLNDVLKPALGKAIENLIPTIQKHLGELIGKLLPGEYVEYMAITDIMEIAQHIKDIFNELKDKIVSGAVKANIVDFLKHLQEVVDAKIAESRPVVKAALEKVKAAIDELIAKAKANAEAGIEQGKGLLVELLEKIMAKLAELKDELAGYNIFDDLLADVLKPALKKAIENLIPTIAKHLGDLVDKLKPAEYMAVADIMEIAQHIKDIFNELKAKIASGEVKASVIDFLKHLKEVIDSKIAAARPIVQEALAKVQAAVDE